MSFEILERIFGTNDKNKNINNESVSNFGVMPMYSLRQGRAYLNDEEKLNENDQYQYQSFDTMPEDQLQITDCLLG